MGVTNMMLLVEIKRQITLNRLDSREFTREKWTLLTILLFFELSYLMRFLEDKQWLGVHHDENLFAFLFVVDLMYILDGISMLALLVFHFRNFKIKPITQSFLSNSSINRSICNDTLVYLQEDTETENSILIESTDSD